LPSTLVDQRLAEGRKTPLGVPLSPAWGIGTIRTYCCAGYGCLQDRSGCATGDFGGMGGTTHAV